LVPVILCLRFTGENEIFYRQERVGYKRKVFKVLKFATMVKNSPNLGAGTLTMKDDPRVLPLGGILRKTKINEIPQLLNVFFGDMAIVGPRPLVPNGEEHYGTKNSEIIRSVKPGVTGIGSLVLRDEESYYAHRPDALDFYKDVISPYKFTLEKWYIERKTIGLDLKILILTVLAVLNVNFNLWIFFPDLPKTPEKMINSQNQKDY
jgi:lipopolysaccharide/colanic/teichoic acid biosynthesis glycosyltransferase